MTLDIDFTEPHWLIIYYDAIGIISFCLNSLGIYLLVFHCKKLGKFRHYLLGFQIVCTLFDIHFNFLTKPVPLIPLISYFSVGALSTYFDVPTHYCIMICGFLAVIQLEVLVLCFQKKHQSISETLKYHILPDLFRYFCYTLCFVAPVSLCGILHYFYTPHEQQMEYIDMNYQILLSGFSSLSHFVIYILKASDMYWFIGLFIFGAGTLTTMFLFFITDIVRMMSLLKLRLSTATYQKHHVAIQSLFVQFITSTFCLCPPCILVAIVYLDVPNGQIIFKFLIAWFTSHSSVNMLSLCFFFPPYRKFFVEQADNFLVFGYLQRQLEGKDCNTIDKKSGFEEYFESQPVGFWRYAFRKLPEHF
ncbi:unnamed protein product [Caenorhabditis nigoni]